MCTFNVRIGIPELLVAASAAIVIALLAVAIAYDWTYAIVPAATYGLAIAVSYTLYRLYRRYEAEVTVPFESVVRFKVVDTRGTCTLGRKTGDVITVGPAGSVTPILCTPATVALRNAAVTAPKTEVDEWCCPIYDHMLVFRASRAGR